MCSSNHEGNSALPLTIPIFSNSACIIMLSHQNPNIYPQHRRTNSTPAIAITPATTNLKHCMHQRGLTMDQTVYSQPQQYPQQDQGLYRNTNLPEKQYIIREAQQQDPTRPDQSGHESTIRASDTMTQNHFAFEASSKDTEYDTLSKLLQPGTVDNLEGFQCTTEQVDDEQNIDLEDLSRMIGWSEYHWQQAAGASHNDIKRPYTPPSQISSSKQKHPMNTIQADNDRLLSTITRRNTLDSEVENEKAAESHSGIITCSPWSD